MLRREQRELTCVSFWVTFCSDVDEKIDDFGGPGRPCTRLGQGLESGVKKNANHEFVLVLPGALFRDIRHFLALDFSFIF